MELYGDILVQLAAERAHAPLPRRLRWSRVQSRAYVPTERFKRYIAEMEEYGLLDRKKGVLRWKGEEYLQAYRAITDITQVAMPESSRTPGNRLVALRPFALLDRVADAAVEGAEP